MLQKTLGPGRQHSLLAGCYLESSQWGAFLVELILSGLVSQTGVDRG